MSTKRLIKRLLNFKGVAIDSVAIREVNGAESVVVSVHLTKGFALRDPSTGGREPKYDSPPQIRRWRHLDFADVPVYVEMEYRRVKCGDGTVKAEAVPFARQSSRVCASTVFLSSVASARTPAYWQCKNAFRSFAPDMTDEEIVKARGHIPVELYRLASGAREILGHSTSKMTPRGRDRSRRKPIQLLLDIDFGD